LPFVHFAIGIFIRPQLLYERTAISKKPELVAKAELEALRKEDQLSPDLVFRDPYVLQFLNLNDRYMEKDLEDAIMRELELLLLELGTGFTFLARQKRITIDDEDFRIDLLFYHRDLKRLVAIELLCGAPHKNSNLVTLSLNIKDKWNFICGGLTNTNVVPMRNLQWGLFSALERSKRG
jgi:predicted nuclease of restriction endonuclease-like (RecB) superfamily